MKYPIQKERIYLMCPCAVVCAIARLSRPADEAALRDAIRDALIRAADAR